MSKKSPNIKESNPKFDSPSPRKGDKRMRKETVSVTNLNNKKTKNNSANSTQKPGGPAPNDNHLVDNEEEEVGKDDSMHTKSLDSSRNVENLRPILIFDVDEVYKRDPGKIEDLLTKCGLNDNVESVRLDAKGNLLVFAYNEEDIERILENESFFPKSNKLNFNDDKFKPSIIIRGMTNEIAEKYMEHLAEYGISGIAKFEPKINLNAKQAFVKASMSSKEAEKEILELGRLKIGYMSFKVEKFIKPPTQCYKCNKFGHLSKNCPNAMSCSKCAGDHSHENCVGQEPKCINCGEAHSAFDRACRVYRETKRTAFKEKFSQSNTYDNRQDVSRKFSDVVSNSTLIDRFDKIDGNITALTNIIGKLDSKVNLAVTDLTKAVSSLVVSNNKRMASFVIDSVLVLKKNNFSINEDVQNRLIENFEKNCLADEIPLMSNHDSVDTSSKNNMYHKLFCANKRSIFSKSSAQCL